MNPSTPNPFLANGKKSTCMEMLQVILDGEATGEQKEYFKQHMDMCMPCFKGYELDMAIKQLVQSKCCGGDAPSDLVDQIRITIAQKIS
ncbi:MAG TPA: mycothiol system anti-sigma-R factor [Cyclobacteriaceae bacterium]|nr:mycothiol system anti-sigma-R factor [Cyclobacteriaceae bacterium]